METLKLENTKKEYGNYGAAALLAHYIIESKKQSPSDAWDEAINELQCAVKSCPKSTFLGLCKDGWIIGVDTGNYTRSIKNKEYAIEAISLLKGKQILVNQLTPKYLWCRLVSNINANNIRISYNQQMHVLLALWEGGLINADNIVNN